MRRIAVLDAPSNLGLRPPTATSVPGCAKAPGALRDHGLLGRLGARDAGCLTPPRYDPGDWRPGDGVAHAAQINAYSRALADRIGAILDAGEFPVVLGGDCSILLGSGLAMHRLGEAVGGRIGLVFVDGHSDFRHPGNASYVGAAAGEDLALVTGRGQADLAAIEGRRPYFRDIDVVVLGIRAQDEYRLDLQAAGIVTRPVPALRAEGAARSAQWAREQLVDCAGYWLHVDVDVLDPAVLPAVDAPSPGGIAFPELELLLAGLVESPHCLGVEITVFDPDYDPDGAYAAEITSTVTAGLAAARRVVPRPDLAAARADLATARPATDDRQEHPPAARTAPAEPEQPHPTRLGAAESEPAQLRPTRLGAAESELRATRAGAAESDPAQPHPTRPGAAEPEPAQLRPTRLGTAEPEPAKLRPAPRGITELEPAEPEPAEPEPAEPEPAEPEPAEPEPAEPEPAEPEPAEPEPAEPAQAVSEPVSPTVVPAAGEVVDAERAAVDEPMEEAAERDEPAPERAEPVRLASRPLGQAPLLDSEPLPATRPGMLRPRPADDRGDSFSLPAQRPAFDLGSGEPVDIA